MSTTPTTPGADEPDARPRYHHGDLANALTAEAAAMARIGGPEAVVLREAARRVGVSPTAAYRHFASYDRLLSAVKAQAQEALATAMESAQRAEPPRADPQAEALRRLYAIGTAYVRFAMAEPGLFRTAFCRGEPPESGTDQGAADGHGARSFQILRESLDRLVECGLLAPERRPNAEFAAWSAVHGLAILLIDGPLAAMPQEQQAIALRYTLETVINGLTT